MNTCKKSPTGEHEWTYPRLEDSIDGKRIDQTTYCKLCLEKHDDSALPEQNKKSYGDGWFVSQENSHIGRH